MPLKRILTKDTSPENLKGASVDFEACPLRLSSCVKEREMETSDIMGMDGGRIFNSSQLRSQDLMPCGFTF